MRREMTGCIMASYRQFDKYGNPVRHEDLQNKRLWCKEGEKIEEAFVNRHGEVLQIGINPEKETNPYAPDLIFHPNHKLMDLKTQNTPFFKAEKLYGIDPTHAIVFNRKN